MERLINVSQAKDMFGSTHILYEAMKRAGVVAVGKRNEKKYRLDDLERHIAELRASGWHRGERSKQYEKRDGSAPVFSGERKYQQLGKSMTDEEIKNYNRMYPFCRPVIDSLIHAVRSMKQHVTHCRGTKA